MLRFYHMTCFIWHLIRDLAGSFRKRIAIHLARCRGEDTPLIIGWDAFPFLESLTGVGWYSFHLLEYVTRHHNVIINLYAHTFENPGEENSLHANIERLGPAVRLRSHGIPTGTPFRARWFSLLLKGLVEPLFHLVDRNDLFFAPNFFPPRSLAGVSSRMYITVHDLTYKVFPRYVQKETLLNLEKNMPFTTYHSTGIITVSENTRRDLERYYPHTGHRAVTILSGFDPPAGKGGSPVPAPYILFVSTVEPRKNLAALLDTFTLMKQQGYQGKLVIAGKLGWESDKVINHLLNHPYSEDIRHLDYVTRNVLGDLYSHADLFVFPSHYEGFGFPVLEAMANDCPVVAANNSSINEIGGEACAYIDETNPRGIADTIMDLLSHAEKRHHLIEMGRKQVREFSWETAARKTLELMREHG